MNTGDIRLRADVHVCLISEQVTPNITPALDPVFKPKEVILVVSDTMKNRADGVEEALKERAGVCVSRWLVRDAWDIEDLRERFSTLLGERDGHRLALNVTGGTKPMGIAAYEVFRHFDAPIYYVHPEQDRIIWMHPSDVPSHDLANRIKLPDFLLAHGNRVSREGSRLGVRADLRRLTTELVEKVERYARPLAALNWAAAAAKETLVSPEVDAATWRQGDFVDLCQGFEHHGLLQKRGTQLAFPDESARVFVNGGWLETYVYFTVLDLKKQTPIQDVRRGIEITRGRGVPVTNELDVAFLAENRLYLIECKTKRFKGTQSPDSDSAHALYKLETLTDTLGGLKASGMLVSYQPLGKHDRKRAAEYNIKVATGGAIRNLRQVIIQWIRNQ